MKNNVRILTADFFNTRWKVSHSSDKLERVVKYAFDRAKPGHFRIMWSGQSNAQEWK